MDTVRNQSRYAVQPDWRNLLEKLVVQIQAGEPRDQMEHRLTNNVHYLGPRGRSDSTRELPTCRYNDPPGFIRKLATSA
jgi:hypothetical protein